MSRTINRVRIGAAVGIIAGSVLALSACSSTTDVAKAGSDTNNKLIGVSISDQTSLFYIAEAEGIQAEAKAKGYKVVLQQAGDDGTTQVNQVQNLITQKPGAVIYTPTNETAANSGTKALNDAGIPVIGVDERADPADGRKLVTYIATDSVAAANKLCLWLFDQIGNSGKIGILTGVEGSTAQQQRSQGCQKAIDATPGIKVVGTQTAGWDETKAFNVSQTIISANPDLKAIFAESDAMALGAAKAAAQAGRSLKIVGIDGFPSMFAAIPTGSPNATMAQQPYHMGQLAVDDAIEAIKGDTKGIPAEQYQDTVLITKDNVANYSVTQFYGPTAK